MKVLTMANYLYDSRYPEFQRNKTGYGMMVSEIFKGVSNQTDSSFISHVLTCGHNQILKHTISDVIFSAKMADLNNAIKYSKQYGSNYKDRTRYFYYAVNEGYIRKVISQKKPDIVHIHGVGISLMPAISVCENNKIPYLVTLHGLIGLHSSVNTPLHDKMIEKEIIKHFDKTNRIYSVISSGIKRRIIENYHVNNVDNIKVILNGTNIESNEYDPKFEHLRDKYKIKSDYKLLIAIGNICERKNQEQIIRAIKLLTDNSIKCHLFICGNDTTNGRFNSIVRENGLDNIVHNLGFVDKSSIWTILKQVDLNIVASKDEGFGLSIIESLCAGVPTVTFKDLDAVVDLYDKEVMLLSDDRSDQGLADAIGFALQKKWNRDLIIAQSKLFQMKNISAQYISTYDMVRFFDEYKGKKK